jgi:outer membrane protein TolC
MSAFKALYLCAIIASPAYGAAPVLDRLVDHAIRQHPTLQAAQAAAEDARLKWQSQGYFPDPEIKGQYFGEPIETRRGPQRANVMLSQTIPWPGKLSAQEREHESLFQASQARKQLAYRQLVLEVKKEYFRLDYRRNQERLLEEEQQALNDLKDLAKARVRLGKGRHQEVVKLNLNLGQLTEKTLALKQTIRRSLWSLAELTGMQLATIDELTHSESTEAVTIEAISVKTTAVERMIAQFPGLQIREAQQRAQAAAARQAELDIWPNLMTSVTWFRIDEPENTGMGAASDAGRDAWAIGLGFKLPIWSGKYDYRKRAAQAKSRQKSAAIAEIKRELLFTINDLLTRIQTAEQVLTLYQKELIPQARQVYETNQQAYTQDAVSYETVTDDLRDLLSLKREFIRQKKDWLLALAQLEFYGLSQSNAGTKG